MSHSVYEQLFNEFKDTLKVTSIDTDDPINPTERECYMTHSDIEVINFDKFKESFARNFRLPISPKSCDALYMSHNNEWFLNGKLPNSKLYEVIWKIFESLLLLMEKLNNTISFTRTNMNFILVYNEEKEAIDRKIFAESLESKAKEETDKRDTTIKRLMNFEKLYFKNVYLWDRKEFESQFVEKYCRQYLAE